MATKKYLKVNKGNVELFNINGQKVKSYYTKGDAVHACWEDEIKESVQVQLKNGKIVLVNCNCQIYKTI